LGTRTESSNKFEKGLPAYNTYPALMRALELTEMLGAGEVVPGVIDILNTDIGKRRIPFDIDRINALIGIDITSDQAAELLAPLDLIVDGKELIVPPYRYDMEKTADITEEITLDVDEFIKAINDAINAEANKNSSKAKKAKRVAPVKEPEPEIEEEEIEVVEEIEEVNNLPDASDEDDIFAADEVPFDLDDEPFDEEAVKEQIRKLHKAASPETKKAVKAILGGAKLNEVHDAETLNKVLEALA
jgi:hypothetical protein